jgi:thioesterase domain-containing protein
MNLRELAVATGTDQPFYGLQYRGVDGEHEPHHTIRAMAEEFAEHIREVQPKGPYYLGGYSVGGLPAFETATILRQQGEEVGLLVLLDTFNPTLPTWTFRQRIFAHLQRLRGEGPRYIKYRVIGRIERTKERGLRRLHAQLASKERFEYRHAAVELACLQAQREYVPGVSDVNILLLKAELRLGASDGIGYQEHESNGWRDHVGTLSIEHVPCQHLDIVLRESAPKTAAFITRALSNARDRYATVAPARVNAGTPDERPHPGPKSRSNGVSVGVG